MRRLAISMTLAVAWGGLVQAQTPVQTVAAHEAPDWGQALREDAQDIHDIISDSHPGPVDADNPAFRSLLEGGLDTALQRAGTARTYEDWYFAIGEYAASFDDAHLYLGNFKPNPQAWRMAWPGFLTVQRSDANVVSYVRDPAAPPIGAELISCDDRPAEVFATEFVGAGVGRWNLQARREMFSNTLFVDQTNPYVRRASTCVFKVNGTAKRYDLQWRPLSDADRDEGLATGRDLPFAPPTGLRPFGSNGGWISTSSFDSTKGSAATAALSALADTVNAQARSLRGKKIIVFDLRGNQGGSSIWMSDMARTLWGEGWVAQNQTRSAGVDWRASQANLAEIASYRTQLADNPTLIAWVDVVEAGLTSARAAGEPLGGKPPTKPSPPPPARRPTCTLVSACLDAVDLLTALGARHVGQETSADSVYMNAREQRLRSGRATIDLPMKVYRGRKRGNNEPAKPFATWIGSSSDTAGLEAWITDLDHRQSAER